ncbi:MAG: hypothetical protein ACAI38_15950 [Myxococcota bacterium]
MKTAGPTLPVSSPSQAGPIEPVAANRLPVTAQRHAELRAQIAAETGALRDAPGRAGVIDRALQYGYVNRLGMPTVKRILGEFGLSAHEVERVAGMRAQNPVPGRDRLDRQGQLDSAGSRRLLGNVTEPATRRLPFA